MSNRYHLTAQEIDELEYEHGHTRAKRYADRLKAVYLLGSGWQVSQVAQALMIAAKVYVTIKRYRKGGLMALLRNDAGGSECALNTEQRQQLTDYLQSHLCLTAKQVAHYVQQIWQISYSERAITQLLHRLGFVYKKPKLIPGKADAERQRAFIDQYRELQAGKPAGDRLISYPLGHKWMPHNPRVFGNLVY